jgi:hypothetical protein
VSRHLSRELARIPITLALLAVLTAPAAHAGDWLPLIVGNHWDYVDGSSAAYSEQITGSISLLGRTVFVKSYIGGSDNGLVNYWQSDASGVYLAGFDNASAAFALAYDPPIKWLAVPPALNAIWHTPAVAYELPAMTVFANLDIQLQVMEDVVLTVPAGNFHCFGVGQVPIAGAQDGVVLSSIGQEFTLDGRRVRAGAQTLSDATDWYSDNVGDVQIRSSALWMLSSYGAPTATAASTWGAIKRLYR